MAENKDRIRNGTDDDRDEAVGPMGGAILGSVFGPLGTVVGAIAGALGNQVGDRDEGHNVHESDREK
jgi:hypothetical protein